MPGSGRNYNVILIWDSQPNSYKNILSIQKRKGFFETCIKEHFVSIILLGNHFFLFTFTGYRFYQPSQISGMIVDFFFCIK